MSHNAGARANGQPPGGMPGQRIYRCASHALDPESSDGFRERRFIDDAAGGSFQNGQAAPLVSSTRDAAGGNKLFVMAQRQGTEGEDIDPGIGSEALTPTYFAAFQVDAADFFAIVFSSKQGVRDVAA